MTSAELIDELIRMSKVAVEQCYDPRTVNVLFEDPTSADQSDVSYADFEDGEVILKH
jgi:hypothetical protein